MSPFKLISAVRDLSRLIEEANRLAGPEKRWSLALTNRSFLASCIAFVAALALMFGLPFPVPVDVATETLFAFITVGGLAWAGVERLFGKTRGVWNRKQAVKAIQEADALTTALQGAGLPAQKP